MDGEIWPSPNNTCENCTCTNGVISCFKRPCPRLGCKFPADPDPSKGECCPYCLSKWKFVVLANSLFIAKRELLTHFDCRIFPGNCSLGLNDYEHGDAKYIGCYKWECNDGTMNSTSVCPPLSCPESEQMHVADTCCKFCKGDETLLDLREVAEHCTRRQVDVYCNQADYRPNIG